MSNINKPMGLNPIQNADGSPWNQQQTLYAVANDASNTYAIGDIVKSASGADVNGVAYVTKAAASDVPLGVITGIRVASPGTSLQGTSLSLEKLYIGKSAGLQYVFVCDDPSIIFELQADADASATIFTGNFHKNASPVIVADQTSTLSMSAPLSNTMLASSTVNTTNTLMLRILGAVQKPDNQLAQTSVAGSGAYTRLRVKFNQHEFNGGFTGV